MAELSQCPFLVKLWQMLADEENFEVLAWDESGESFHVRGSLNAISKMLQRYFRHNKYSSFQRQLNYFGFKKYKLSDGTVIYYHQHFCLDRPNDVLKIRRKTNTGAREKQQERLGKRKIPAPPSPLNKIHQLASANSKPKRVRVCISPSEHARTIKLRDITNKTPKARASASERSSVSSSRRSKRLAGIIDDEHEAEKAQKVGPLPAPLSEFEEIRFSWDGSPLDKLYPELRDDDMPIQTVFGPKEFVVGAFGPPFPDISQKALEFRP